MFKKVRIVFGACEVIIYNNNTSSIILSVGVNTQ